MVEHKIIITDYCTGDYLIVLIASHLLPTMFTQRSIAVFVDYSLKCVSLFVQNITYYLVVGLE